MSFLFHVEKNDDFPISRVREITLKVLQKNVYFVYHEHILLTILGDSEKMFVTNQSK